MKIYGSEVWPSHVWGSDICGVSEILQSWMRDSELRYLLPSYVCVWGGGVRIPAFLDGKLEPVMNYLVEVLYGTKIP